MPYSFRERLGMFLQEIPVIKWLVLTYHHENPQNGAVFYLNRVSRHLVRQKDS